MSSETRVPIFVKDNGWRDDFTLAEAVRSVALEAEDADNRLEALAFMIAAMLEKQTLEEQLRVLNAGSRYVWRTPHDHRQL
jgi:hypothetical protein